MLSRLPDCLVLLLMLLIALVMEIATQIKITLRWLKNLTFSFLE
jgi:hypothetical protein